MTLLYIFLIKEAKIIAAPGRQAIYNKGKEKIKSPAKSKTYFNATQLRVLGKAFDQAQNLSNATQRMLVSKRKFDLGRMQRSPKYEGPQKRATSLH